MTRLAPIFVIALLVVPVAIAAAISQTHAATPIRIQIAFSRYAGDTQLSTQSEVLELDASGKAASVRSGSEVAVGQSVHQVGTQIDCSAIAVPDGRFKLLLTVTHRSLYDEAQAAQIAQRAPGMPVARNFIIATPLLLGDGQSTQILATDKVSNEILKVDVTLSLKK